MRLQSHEQKMSNKSLVDVAVLEASSMNVNANLHRQMSSPETENTQMVETNNEMRKTASWLKRAEDVLSKDIGTTHVQKEIEDEMMVISSLVSEAEGIAGSRFGRDGKDDIDGASTTTLKTPIPSSHIPIGNDSYHIAVKLNESGSIEDEVNDSPTYPMKILATLSSQATPVPIIDASLVTCATPSSTTVATEDAEDFVNFLQSVVQVREK